MPHRRSCECEDCCCGGRIYGRMMQGHNRDAIGGGFPQPPSRSPSGCGIPAPPSRMPSISDDGALGMSPRSGIEGGKFSLKSVGKAFKSVGKVLKPFASGAVDVALPMAMEAGGAYLGIPPPISAMAVPMARSGVRSLTGVGVGRRMRLNAGRGLVGF